MIEDMLRQCVRWSRRAGTRAATSVFPAWRAWVSAARAIVIAPHPDDETFGCGGLMAAKRLASGSMDVAFLTAGEASHRTCCAIDSSCVAEARQALAGQAAGVLGVHAAGLHWLGLEDGWIPDRGKAGFEEAVGNLCRVLEEVAPQEVFCPHPLDCWPDHEAAAQITLAAVERLGRPVKLHFYLVWGWYNMPLRYLPRLGLRKAWRLDIRPVLEANEVRQGELV